MELNNEEEGWDDLSSLNRYKLFWNNMVYNSCFKPDNHPFQNDLNEMFSKKLLFTENHTLSNVRDDPIFYEKELYSYKTDRAAIESFL